MKTYKKKILKMKSQRDTSKLEKKVMMDSVESYSRCVDTLKHQMGM